MTTIRKGRQQVSIEGSHINCKIKTETETGIDRPRASNSKIEAVMTK
jgi:hypothetical protein